jgi:hypothetical protein
MPERLGSIPVHLPIDPRTAARAFDGLNDGARIMVPEFELKRVGRRARDDSDKRSHEDAELRSARKTTNLSDCVGPASLVDQLLFMVV